MLVLVDMHCEGMLGAHLSAYENIFSRVQRILLGVPCAKPSPIFSWEDRPDLMDETVRVRAVKAFELRQGARVERMSGGVLGVADVTGSQGPPGSGNK